MAPSVIPVVELAGELDTGLDVATALLTLVGGLSRAPVVDPAGKLDGGPVVTP